MKKIKFLLILFVFIFVSSSLYPAARRTEKILNGKILTVNKEFNFVIINLGKKDNLKKGIIFLVYRENKLIGKVEVEETFKDMSSCVIVPWISKEELKRDDGVLKP
jgi:hypothetical protein